MAFSTQGKVGGVKSDINVTPLVDVMLVLLIIMMLIAPMLNSGVQVKLPEAAETNAYPESQDQIVLAITADNRLYVDSVQVRQAEVTTQVQAALETTTEKLVLIKADEEAPYSSVMAMMDELRKIAVEDIGLVTERKLRAGDTGGGE